MPKENSHGGKEKVYVENQILFFLWWVILIMLISIWQKILIIYRFAGNQCCLRDVSQRYGIDISTLWRQIWRDVDFSLHIPPSIIKMPSTEEVKELVFSEFQKVSGFKF